MSTEKRTSSVRSRTGTILYWLLIALVMYLCATSPSGGAAGHGNGPGAGNSGDGPGAGSGTGSSRTAPGTGTGTTAAAPAKKPVIVTVVTPAEKDRDKTGQHAADSASAPVPVPKVNKTVPPPQAAVEFGASAVQTAEGTASGGGTRKGFFGVEVVNEGNLLFILDVSSSMNSSCDGSSRIELLKKELLKVLDARKKQGTSSRDKDGRFVFNNSSSTQHFRLITFSCSYSIFPDSSQSALRFSRQEHYLQAKKHIDSLDACGGTSMKMVWGSSDVQDLLKKDAVQTICFLSDGAPTDCCPQELIQLLKNKYPRVKIHTFSMGCSSQLLKDIAAQHNGKYVEIY